MPFFKVDDALHSHPKARKAGLEAMGLWALSGSHCMAYLTDGFVAEWFVKTYPKGAALARRLVAAGMWRPDQRDGENGWSFHDWTDIQDTKQQIEADRKKARERKRRQRESQGLSQGDNHEDNRRDSARTSGYTQYPIPNTQKNSGYEPKTTHQSDAHAHSTGRRSPKRHSSSAAKTVVRQTLGTAGYPRTTTDRLAVQVDDLAREGHSDTLIRESLAEWDRRDDCDRPEFLPTVLGDVVKRSRAAPGTNGKPHKLRAMTELARQARQAETAAQLENAQQPKELT